MSLNPKINAWRGKRVWLVGASTGIGKATAELLYAQGAQVIVSARSLPALQEMATQHPGMQTLPLDATDEAAVKVAASQLFAQGSLDLVM